MLGFILTARKQTVERPVVEKHFMERIVEKEVEKLVVRDREVDKIVEVLSPLFDSSHFASPHHVLASPGSVA
jgi:superfamily II helicase